MYHNLPKSRTTLPPTSLLDRPLLLNIFLRVSRCSLPVSTPGIMALNEDQYSLRARLVEDSLPKLDLLGPLYGMFTVMSGIDLVY